MNKRIRTLALFLVVGVCLFCLEAEALEEKFEDFSASVEVAPVFSLVLDRSDLTFGSLTPGKTQVLGEKNFFNQISCRSNSGRTWLLKAQLVSLKSVERDYSLEPSNLKWKIVDCLGCAEPLGGKIDFEEFSNEPVLIYASGGDDNRGKEVRLKFQYSLTCPWDAPAGDYIGGITFTLTESP